MAETPISPKQSNPSAATATQLYDCPDNTTFVGVLYVANRSATATTFRVSVRIDNASADDAQFLAYDAAILGNEVVKLSGITVTHDDRVFVYATLATLSFSLMGIEKT